MLNIDVKAILQETVSQSYGDLVTRHTGRAVRSGIEDALNRASVEQIAMIDFSDVRCLDISCADEVVGKLLLTHGNARYFLLRGVTESHCEAINLVLERHGLAIVAQSRDGKIQLLGLLHETTRKAFGVVAESGTAAATDVAERLAVSADAAREVLDELRSRRLIQQEADHYRALIS